MVRLKREDDQEVLAETEEQALPPEDANAEGYWLFSLNAYLHYLRLYVYLFLILYDCWK